MELDYFNNKLNNLPLNEKLTKFEETFRSKQPAMMKNIEELIRDTKMVGLLIKYELAKKVGEEINFDLYFRTGYKESELLHMAKLFGITVEFPKSKLESKVPNIYG